jgi:hypothetical protein
VEVKIEGWTHIAILDSGCDRTMIPPHLVEGIPLEPSDMLFFALGGEPIPLLGKIALEIELGETSVDIECYVTPKVDDVFLGIDWMRKCKMEWSFGDDSIVVGGSKYVLRSQREIRQEMNVAQARSCRAISAEVTKPVPLMEIVFSESFVPPDWMEPPCGWKCPMVDSCKMSCAAIHMTSKEANMSTVTEAITRSVPASEPSSSVRELPRKLERAMECPNSVVLGWPSEWTGEGGRAVDWFERRMGRWGAYGAQYRPARTGAVWVSCLRVSAARPMRALRI